MPDQATDHRNIQSSWLAGENKINCVSFLFFFGHFAAIQQDRAYLFQCQLLWDGFILHFLDFLHELVDLELLLLLQMLLQLRLLMLELQRLGERWRTDRKWTKWESWGKGGEKKHKKRLLVSHMKTIWWPLWTNTLASDHLVWHRESSKTGSRCYNRFFNFPEQEAMQT